jgi:hypothetical protein
MISRTPKKRRITDIPTRIAMKSRRFPRLSLGSESYTHYTQKKQLGSSEAAIVVVLALFCNFLRLSLLDDLSSSFISIAKPI